MKPVKKQVLIIVILLNVVNIKKDIISVKDINGNMIYEYGR